MKMLLFDWSAEGSKVRRHEIQVNLCTVDFTLRPSGYQNRKNIPLEEDQRCDGVSLDHHQGVTLRPSPITHLPNSSCNVKSTQPQSILLWWNKYNAKL